MSNYTNGNMAMLFDSTKCTACKGCQIACKQWNVLYSPLGKNEIPFPGSYQSPLDLNGSTRLIMTFDEKETKDDVRPVEWAFGRRSCYHCTDAGCVAICPSGALHYEPNGVVGVDKDKCIGCMYCQNACPFDVPRYYGGKAIIDKCDMCYSRLDNGIEPACVKTCQPGALMFGPRDEMIKKGKERVEFAKKRGYDKAELYGEHEMGGLHILTVAKYGHEAHGLPTDPQIPTSVCLGNLTKPAVALASGLTFAGLAVSFIAALGYRRKQLTVAEAEKTWTPRQQKYAEELVKERLKKDAQEYKTEQKEGVEL